MLIAPILAFLSIFNYFRIFCVNIENLCHSLSGTIEARILKLDIHMDNEVLYFGIVKGAPCYFSLNLFFFPMSFRGNFVLWPSNMVYIIKQSDCMVGWRLRLSALNLTFFIHFPSFRRLHFIIENLCHGFLRNN